MKRIAAGSLLCALLMYGATVVAVTLEDFFEAAEAGDVATLNDLLDRGMPVEATDIQGYSVLMYAARAGQLESVRLLLERGAKVDARNALGETALMLAAFNGHLATTKFLLRLGAAIDAGQGQWSALHYAANQNQVEVLRLLLERGADPNAQAVNGITPLHMAAREGAVSAIELLLRAGADPRRQTASGETARAWAEAAQHAQAAALLAAPSR